MRVRTRSEAGGLGDVGEDGKIIAVVLHEAHERQVGEAMGALEEGPEGFYKTGLEQQKD